MQADATWLMEAFLLDHLPEEIICQGNTILTLVTMLGATIQVVLPIPQSVVLHFGLTMGDLPMWRSEAMLQRMDQVSTEWQSATRLCIATHQILTWLWAHTRLLITPPDLAMF